ncbi:MAG: hypothetical protein ABJB05_02680 [Parafilimonas sp.]
MKKISLAAILAVMLSAGFTLQTKAQTTSINIENLTATNKEIKTPVAITETPIYNKSGKLLYTVKRYDASSLPKDVSRMVRNTYTDFDIIGVEEVVLPTDNNSIYLVHIGNDKKIETVRVFNGNSEVIKEYKKG